MAKPVSFGEHVFKNLALIGLSILFVPLTTPIVLACLVWQAAGPLVLRRHHRQRPGSRRKTVLVSSLAMGKGLSLARAFHLAGNRVIGIDFDATHFVHSPVPSSGRFSNALAKYYVVTTPRDDRSRARYAAEMLDLVKKEGVDLWVCVSGVASTVEDALLKDTIEKETQCRVFQPDPQTCRVLHDKHEFIRAVEGAGLPRPKTVLVESHGDVFRVLQEHPGTSFILKCVGLDDASRADMTQLPRPTDYDTVRFVCGLEISSTRRWVAQEFIGGAEFCTHAVVVRGEVQAFVACPSSEMLMHYEPLPAESRPSRAMLAFTRRLIRTLEGGRMTGQVSFDFLADAERGNGGGGGGREGEGEKEGPKDVELYPIECNPRTHTAVILLAQQQPQGLSNAYLSLLDEPKLPCSKARGKKREGRTFDDFDAPTVGVRPFSTESGKPRFYWIGHDFVVHVALPLLQLMALKMGPLQCARSVFWFLVRVAGWKDATFEAWDPLPWWWLYHVYYPWLCITSLATGKRWSRINTSTTNVFEA